MDSIQIYPLGSLLLALESGDKEDSPEYATISMILENFSVDDSYWQEEFIIASAGIKTSVLVLSQSYVCLSE